MKKAIKLSAVTLFAGLAFGCASQGDLNKLQDQVNGLDSRVKQVANDAADAKSQAAAASDAASRAEAAANQAAQYAQETNAKLDNLFNVTQGKGRRR
jgi:murein lipoprotein